MHKYEAQPSRGTNGMRDEEQQWQSKHKIGKPTTNQQRRPATENGRSKETYGSYTSSVKYHSETQIITNIVMKQSKWYNGDLKPEHERNTNIDTVGPTATSLLSKN